MSPRTGRPPVDNPKNTRIELRVTKAEKDELQKFCLDNKVGYLDLIRIGKRALEEEQK